MKKVGSKLNKHGFWVFRVIERLMNEWFIALANVWKFNARSNVSMAWVWARSMAIMHVYV